MVSPVGKAEDLIAQLTLDEKVSLCHGADFWSTTAIERLGIPRMWVTDGPHGARGRTWSHVRSTSFPIGTAIGATWDPSLAQQLGEALGRQTRSKGAGILLGPTMNIHRTPLAGRNFECYSEDPHLSARLAAAAVKGIQSVEGVGACIKHLVCNDQEHERMTISSEVDERTLREIYLVPFEACVKEARAWSVMTGYNKLNGTYCAEHFWLLQDVLRGEWGFEGYVISDWWGTKSTVESANAGLDLEMPGPPNYFGANLLDAVKNGEVSEEVLDDKIRRLIDVLEKTGKFDSPDDPGESALDDPADRVLIRKAGAESIVLLRNKRGVLPLDVKRLAVIGPYADVPRFGGGGSSAVFPHYLVSPMEGIRSATGGKVDISFARGSVPYVVLPQIPTNLLSTAGGNAGLDATFFDDLDAEEGPGREMELASASQRWVGTAPVSGDRFSLRATSTFTPTEDGAWTFGISAAGRIRLLVDDELLIDNWDETEPGKGFFGLQSKEKRANVEMRAGEPHKLTVVYRASTSAAAGFHLGCISPIADDPVAQAAETAREAEAAVVIVGLDETQETEGEDRESMDLPGGQDELVRAVAAAQPNTVVVVVTGSVISMPWAGEAAGVLQAWYLGQESGNAIADVLFGNVNPCGKLPTTIPLEYSDNPTYGAPTYPGEDGKVHYTEGMLIGYRHYDSEGIEPRFPFGHGLSYTTFDYGELDVKVGGSDVVVETEVTNSGAVGGNEVVQLYVRDRESSVPRPDKELRAFEKLWLDAGETKKVSFALGPRAFAFWDPESKGWKVEPGEFELLCGSSSRDIRAVATVTR
jgi:beta-glucosidase